jgi:4,4'-diaponeurosporenoate glycosyltransferase
MDALTISLAVRWMAGWYLGGRLPTLRSLSDGGATHATVSVIVPARNEAASLPGLLGSLRAQTTPPREVIVVDDHSSDATSRIAAEGGATVLASAPLPAGWLGKPWACAQGAAAATGDILVFLDADTVAGPECIGRLAAAVSRVCGLVSVAPYHQTERLHESASALFNLVAVMGVGASSLGRSRATGAFGPCIAIRAAHYETIGGHLGVRHEVLEDIALARACERQAIPVVNVAGAGDLRYRMHPDGPAQLIEGWSKNFAAGAAATPPARLIAIVAWLSGAIESGLMAASGGAVHVVFYILFAVQLKFMLGRIGNYSRVAWLHPVATLTLVAICLRSALLQWRGQVTWKGRTIPVGRGVADD